MFKLAPFTKSDLALHGASVMAMGTAFYAVNFCASEKRYSDIWYHLF